MYFRITGTIDFDEDRMPLPEYEQVPDPHDLSQYNFTVDVPHLFVRYYGNKITYWVRVPAYAFPEYMEGFLARIRNLLVTNIVQAIKEVHSRTASEDKMVL